MKVFEFGVLTLFVYVIIEYLGGKMKFTQIRHGSCIIELDNLRFLIDPVLYKKHTLPAIIGGIKQKNPLVDICVGENILKNIDFIILTHLHFDHFDPKILEYYGSNIQIICSEKFKKKLSQMGFVNINSVKNQITIKGIEVNITKSKHGTGIIGKMMGKSYGFVLRTSENNVVYITGDTVWCNYVEEAIEKYKPKYIIAFAGSAKVMNIKITLDENGINKILEKTPSVKLIVNHMDAWNHCSLTREVLKNVIRSNIIFIPSDGETINI